MNYFRKQQWIRIALSVVVVAVVTLFLTGVIGGKPMTYQAEEPLTPMMSAITVSMERNSENSKAEDYLEQDPYLVNIYEGYGFSKDYKAARGHEYTLEDVTGTARPHAKANCITCKTPDFTKMVNAEGVEVYSRPFDEVMAKMTDAISCYTCHGDDKGNNGQIVITHSYVDKALGENASSIDPKVLNCGQCHIEYYFTTEDSETMMPYHDQEGMTPEAILAYYDEMGFKDWEQPGTGTQMLKAQHPEMETFLSSTHAQMGLNCASCHMAEETAEDGSTYHSHYLVSPLQSETLMATCASCHGSAEAAKTLVTSTQEKVTAREREVGNRLSELKDTLTAAVSEGKMSEEELNGVRKLHREAQWFFDFCYVENSEGAHNSKLSTRCLNTADEKITEALRILSGEPEPEKTEEPAWDREASEQGFHGTVTVRMNLAEDGTISELVIETPDETAGLGQKASEAEFINQFIGKAGPFTYGEDVDAIAGATITSNAVLKALSTALGLDAPAVEEAVTGATAVSGATATSEEAEPTAAPETEEAVTGATAVSGATATSEEAEPTAAPETEEAVTGATATSEEPAATEEPAVTETPATEKPTATEAPAATEKAAATEKPAEKSAAAEPALIGSYLAVKETNFSIIRVIVTTENGKITGCRILSEAKSEGSDFLTDQIREDWAKAIVKSGSAETDAITGATLQFSAGAVQEAVKEILEKAAGK